MAEKRFLLWDIDQTLIDTGGAGRTAFAAAFAAATGVPMREMADPAGQLDPHIFADTLELHGLTYDAAGYAHFAGLLAAGYREHAERMRTHGKVLEGVPAALKSVLHRDGVISTVLTGNSRAGAEAKLEIFELAGYLDLAVGAYGEDEATRAELVPRAWQRAERRHRIRFDPARTLVIGDTPRDIAAAHANGVEVVAVASGRFSQDELRTAGADFVLPDLTGFDLSHFG
ncbi:HAD family hydrolase [Nocardia panacis]|uniref:HAD family hydrolase n=1 Tax=Nocardia panacis TaxID=2340916 RepID=UPI0013153F13|nr:HAD family hydrolase [Nocardia panacis]